jgi:2-aminoethylphosphonate-pyruvate transaminase
MRDILLNPGPVTLSDGVRSAATAVDLCHREAEFFDLQERLNEGLLAVYDLEPTSWQAVMLGGSGTSALEAMVSSLVPAGAKALVLENGVYGERLSRIAAIYGIDAESVRHEWQDPWDLQRVNGSLDSGRFTHVLAVHHETTTGRLNPVGELAGLCEAHNVELLLDSISAFGAEAIPFDSPSLIGCAATANKCLHGIPGLCFVVCRRATLESAGEARSLTLHLPLWADHQQRRSTPFTPSVNAMLALDKALEELRQAGGWRARQARYIQLAEAVGVELDDLGIEPLLEPGESSCVLRSYKLPGDTSYDEVHGGLKERGYIVYAGQGALAREMFRISTMGDISDDDLARLRLALREVFTAE